MRTQCKLLGVARSPLTYEAVARFFDEELDAVGRHQVSDVVKPEKTLRFSYENDEVPPLLATKEKPPVNDTIRRGSKNALSANVRFARCSLKSFS